LLLKKIHIRLAGGVGICPASSKSEI